VTKPAPTRSGMHPRICLRCSSSHKSSIRGAGRRGGAEIQADPSRTGPIPRRVVATSAVLSRTDTGALTSASPDAALRSHATAGSGLGAGSRRRR
jgi:hypothetical protein